LIPPSICRPKSAAPPENGATSPTFTGSAAAAGMARAAASAASAFLSVIIVCLLGTKLIGRAPIIHMKPFTFLAVVIFTLVALMHVVRLALGWTVLINGVEIPLAVSPLLAAFAVLLAVMVWREGRKSP